MRTHALLFGTVFFFSAMSCSNRAAGIEPAHLNTQLGLSPSAIKTCAAEWSEVATYAAGESVSLSGIAYQANVATVGQNPKTFSGNAQAQAVWLLMGRCTQNLPATPAGGSTVAGPAVGPNFIFSPYKDVSINANYNTGVISSLVTGVSTSLLQAAANVSVVTWAFATGECGAETWGGSPAAALVTANVADWVAAKKSYIISTGGAAGSFTCASDAGFGAFLDRYLTSFMLGVDFDIEAGQTQADIEALVARVKAAQANPKYKNLRFSFTLATLGGNVPGSLGQAGVLVVEAIKKQQLTGYTINLMTMDYGSDAATNCVLNSAGRCDMGASAVQAALNLNSTYHIPFSQIEITPMIGGNDTQGEVFTLDDVNKVASFARQKGLAGIHFWSFDRDVDCVQDFASPTCNSYGKGGSLGFTKAFTAALAVP